MTEARQLGYGYVGVSGGEPLLWRHLEEFLAFAKGTGFSTSISTNGTLLTRQQAARLRDLVGLVAVSVDGPPEDHAVIRDSPTAFSQMQAGLSMLRAAGIPFTLAFTLTRYNAHRLAWLYSFARQAGAQGVHIHPLSCSGAATKNLAEAVPDTLEFEIAACLMALVMAQPEAENGPAAIFDVIRRSVIEKSDWPLLLGNAGQLPVKAFADLVPALIVEPDGCIVPFTYGFPRQWSIGYLDQQPLAAAAARWLAASAGPVAGLLQGTLARLAAEDVEYLDLFGELMISAG
jgi:organic radical activating enzyme